jgi:hypothetical protein
MTSVLIYMMLGAPMPQHLPRAKRKRKGRRMNRRPFSFGKSRVA